MSTTPVLLTSSLPAPYREAYALPLLFLSIPVLLGGAFLTLDRTRSFPPNSIGSANKEYSALPKRRWRFEGGIGGLIGGWLLGFHACTYLTLLATNREGDASLSPSAFLVLWIFSSILCAVLAARFRAAAYLMISILGGASLSLFVSMIFQSSLLARAVLLCVFTLPLVSAAMLSVIVRPDPSSTLPFLVQHIAIRFSMALLGSFSLCVAIATLAGISEWANIWTRLAVDGGEWGGATDKGLTAGACIMALVGFGTDWVLHRRFGEDPAERWDAYLAEYTAALPAAYSRAGTFQPVRSLFQRLFHPSSSQTLEKPMLFPPTPELKTTTLHPLPRRRPLTLKRPYPRLQFPPSARRLPNNDYDSDEESGSLSRAREEHQRRPQMADRAETELSGLSGTTLGSDDEENSSTSQRDKGLKVQDLEYSDDELDNDSQELDLGEVHWNAGLRRVRTLAAAGGFRPLMSIPGSVEQSAQAVPGSLPPAAVPATPSLIKALHRIARAREVFVDLAEGNGQELAITVGHEHEHDEGWREFWDDVREKARIGRVDA